MKSLALIIRFHYKEDDPRFGWRFSYFVAMVLPRIMKQTDQNFDICIWCNPKHDQMFKALSPRIKVFHVEKDVVKYKQRANGRTYYYDFTQWEDVIGLDKYDIQVGVDSDDFIGPNFIEIIRRECENAKESLHICFQPRTFNLKTLEVKGMMRYHARRGSAFLALYQPDKTNYKFIYCDSHITMWKHAKKSISFPAGHCWATIHDINESTGK